MRLVVDASVAVKWFVREEDSDAATFLRDGRHEIFAPRLMATEIGNALRRKVTLGDWGEVRRKSWPVRFHLCWLAGLWMKSYQPKRSNLHSC